MFSSRTIRRRWILAVFFLCIPLYFVYRNLQQPETLPVIYAFMIETADTPYEATPIRLGDELKVFDKGPNWLLIQIVKCLPRVRHAPLLIEEFVAGLDVELLEYVPDLRRLGFTSSTAEAFSSSTQVSIGHRRMLLNAAEKLRTPSSKLGVSPDVGITTGVANDDDAHRTDYQKGRKKELFPHTRQIDLTATRAQGTDQLNTAPTSEKNKWKFVYKTPLESEIDDLKEQTEIKSAELQSAVEFCQSLTARYASLNVDKSRSQCSLCHLRAGLAKRACPNEPCFSARQCCDVEKHLEEKRQQTEANETKRKISKELEKLRVEIASKEKIKDQVTNTFSATLVNSDPDTYTFPNKTGKGRLLKSQKILNNSWILESHYKGKVPHDLESESKKWKDIIDSHNEKYTKLSKKDVRENDPIKKRLEDNVKYPVVFPKYARKDDENPYTNTSSVASPYMMPPIFYSPEFPGSFNWWNYQFSGFPVNAESPGLQGGGSCRSTPTATVSYKEVYGSPSGPPLPDVPPPALPPLPDSKEWDCDNDELNEKL